MADKMKSCFAAGSEQNTAGVNPAKNKNAAPRTWNYWTVLLTSWSARHILHGWRTVRKKYQCPHLNIIQLLYPWRKLMRDLFRLQTSIVVWTSCSSSASRGVWTRPEDETLLAKVEGTLEYAASTIAPHRDSKPKSMTRATTSNISSQ